MNLLKLSIEAVVVGISTVIMGLIVHLLFGYHAKHANSPTMNQEMLDLVIILFFTGVFLHLLFEVTRVNSWYCKNGNACQS